MHFMRAFVCFITIAHSGQLMPRLHVFVRTFKAMENHLLLQLVSQSRTSSRVAMKLQINVLFFNKVTQSVEMQDSMRHAEQFYLFTIVL